LIGLLLVVGLVIALTRGGDGKDVPAPAAVEAKAVSPAPRTASPSPVASPSATPTPTPSPSPSATPVPVVTFPTPPPAASPVAPAVVRPEVIEDEPPVAEEEPDEGPAAVPISSDVSGQWELTNRVVSTDYDGFRGLNLGYRLTLRQNGSRITGSGQKVTENGTPVANRTPITVSGRIEGSAVVLTFTEQGATRESAGTFRWQLSPDGSSLRGSFWSDAANTNGPSSGRRVQ
jgi:hypothetical protein